MFMRTQDQENIQLCTDAWYGKLFDMIAYLIRKDEVPRFYTIKYKCFLLIALSFLERYAINHDP